MTDGGRRLAAHWQRLSELDPDQSIIDPNDHRGLKNRYIATLRDHAFAESLGSLPATTRLLDYGCGSGSSTRCLLARHHAVLGMDISAGLLVQAKARCIGHDGAVFVRTDGVHVPVRCGSLDAIVTYGVLIYAVDDQKLLALLREMHRSLAPGGRLVLIEQVRRRGGLAENGLKRFRTTREWAALIQQSGFQLQATTILRHGRLPTTAAVKAGLIPPVLWPLLVKGERVIGKLIGVLPGDYADARFLATK